MKCISIRQPWAWAILNAGKRVENRVWRSAPAYRGPILIHAGGSVGTRLDFDGAVECILDVVGRAELPKIVRSLALGDGPHEDCAAWVPHHDLPRGAIVGRAQLVDARIGVMNGDPWAERGALHLVLADVEALVRPIRLKGVLGLFDVPDKLLDGAEWKAVT